MSRLDSFIRRMQAQRRCLDWAAGAVASVPGPVLELGLGNGRTYDHLRERLPERDIYVFDRRIKAHPGCIPPGERLFLGEISDTLPAALARLGRSVALIHSDLGTGVAEENQALAALVTPFLEELLAPGGVAVINHELPVRRWTALEEPEGVAPGRYYIYGAPPFAAAVKETGGVR